MIKHVEWLTNRIEQFRNDEKNLKNLHEAQKVQLSEDTSVYEKELESIKSLLAFCSSVKHPVKQQITPKSSAIQLNKDSLEETKHDSMLQEHQAVKGDS